jgi:excisionase family DNA binding protein
VDKYDKRDKRNFLHLQKGGFMRDTTKILTTSDIARHCGVSRKSVIRWIEQGRIKAYRTPGGHYRIQQTNFLDFLEQFDMPTDFARSVETA